MPDVDRPTLERALALAREQVAILEAALGEGEDRLIPVAQAAPMMRLEYEAARKRARVHGERDARGRWGFRESYVREFLTRRFSQ